MDTQDILILLLLFQARHCTRLDYDFIDQNLQAVPTGLNESTYCLYLDSNDISEIPDNAFQGLTSLEYLYMNYNQIHSISLNAFKGLILFKICMNNNLITSLLPFGAVGGTLNTLELKGNQIAFITKSELGTFTDMIFLYLSGNPILQLPDISGWSGNEKMTMIELKNRSLDCCSTVAIFMDVFHLELDNYPCMNPDLANRTWSSITIQELQSIPCSSGKLPWHK